MNTIKLYKLNSLYFLSLGSNVQYTITEGGIVLKSNVDVSNLTEVPFTIELQAIIENAIVNAQDVVNSVDTLKVLGALIQEKIEDFD